MTLFDAAPEIGGQFNLARRIPGKEEFAETLRYFRMRLAALRRRASARRDMRRADDLRDADAVVVATGIVPRAPAIAGIDHPKVASYVDVIEAGARSGATSRSSAPAASASTSPSS